MTFTTSLLVLDIFSARLVIDWLLWDVEKQSSFSFKNYWWRRWFFEFVYILKPRKRTTRWLKMIKGFLHRRIFLFRWNTIRVIRDELERLAVERWKAFFMLLEGLEVFGTIKAFHSLMTTKPRTIVSLSDALSTFEKSRLFLYPELLYQVWNFLIKFYISQNHCRQ